MKSFREYLSEEKNILSKVKRAIVNTITSIFLAAGLTFLAANTNAMDIVEKNLPNKYNTESVRNIVSDVREKLKRFDARKFDGTISADTIWRMIDRNLQGLKPFNELKKQGKEIQEKAQAEYDENSGLTLGEFIGRKHKPLDSQGHILEIPPGSWDEMLEYKGYEKPKKLIHHKHEIKSEEDAAYQSINDEIIDMVLDVEDTIQRNEKELKKKGVTQETIDWYLDNVRNWCNEQKEKIDELNNDKNIPLARKAGLIKREIDYLFTWIDDLKYKALTHEKKLNV